MTTIQGLTTSYSSKCVKNSLRVSVRLIFSTFCQNKRAKVRYMSVWFVAMLAMLTFSTSNYSKFQKVENISFSLLHLVIQVGVAALFYIPRAVWLIMEGGLMKFLTRGVSGKVVEDAARKREMLIKTFQGKWMMKKQTIKPQCF